MSKGLLGVFLGQSEKAVATSRIRARLAACAGYDSQYAFAMVRVTATLDPETLAKIRRVAGPRGVSSDATRLFQAK
jgi:hypothetical protein